MNSRRLIIVIGLLGLLFFGFVSQNTLASYEWIQTYPLGFGAQLRSMVQTNDGGYILAGHTQLQNGTDNQALLVKTDSSGKTQWNRTYGGPYTNEAHSIVQTSDGGYVVAGVTWPTSADGHFWVFKVDVSGNTIWSDTYAYRGRIHNDNAWSIIKTNDGGYAVVGMTNNFGSGDSDFWLIKINSAGKKEWNSTYGTPGIDIAYSVIQGSDGGYVMTGRENGHQFVLVKTDSSGNKLWNYTYGDPRVNSVGYSLIQTSDGGYAVGGYTASWNGTSSTPYDFWLVKTDSNGLMQWNKTYGGPKEEIARSVVQTEDGGYLLAGYTESFLSGKQNVYLVNANSQGYFRWNQTYGGPGTDIANSLIRTSDGGYLIGGDTDSFGYHTSALLLIKTDSKGFGPPAETNPVTSVWMPQPTNAAAATVTAVIAAGGASILVAAATVTPGLPMDDLSQKIRSLLPDAVKSWLASFMSSKRKLAVDEKTGSPFLPTKSEVIAYVISIAVLGFSFSYVKVDSISQILLVLPMIIGTSILVGFVKTFILIAYSRIQGVWTEYKLWYLGLATFLITTFLFKVPFSSPCRSVHYEPKATKRLSAVISSAEVLITLAFAGIFYLLLRMGYNALGSVGLAMCLLGAFFDTIPVPPMNGKAIFDYSKPLWIALFAVTLALYAYWLLLI